MNESIEPISAEIRILGEAYAALNRNDVDGFVRDFDPQIERVELIDVPQGVTYRGLEAVKEHVSKGRSTWAEGGCEPERFVVSGDKVVVFVHVRVRLNEQTEWIDGRATDVYAFRNGKIVQFRTFGDEGRALEWAGVRE